MLGECCLLCGRAASLTPGAGRRRRVLAHSPHLTLTPLLAHLYLLPNLLPLQIARDKLVALGTCIGKFTHSGKFRVTIGALDLLAQYAKYKVGL